MASPYGVAICDPGPCDPGAVDLVLRDFGLWSLLLFAVTAFVSGRKFSRSNLALPLLCMATVATAFLISLEQNLAVLRGSFGGDGSVSTDDLRLMELLRQRAVRTLAIGYLTFALAPFLTAVLLNAVQRQWRNRHPNPSPEGEGLENSLEGSVG